MSTESSNPFSSTAEWIREQDLSRSAWIATPFGRRLICYADLTATGRHLPAIEGWVHRVRPFYANTHTEVSTTGRIMTELRESARRLIRDAVKAGEDDEVLFCGSGATAAVNKLVGLLGLRIPEPLEREYDLSRAVPAKRRPVVFVGSYEHHSNELPWVESIAEVIENRARQQWQYRSCRPHREACTVSRTAAEDRFLRECLLELEGDALSHHTDGVHRVDERVGLGLE